MDSNNSTKHTMLLSETDVRAAALTIGGDNSFTRLLEKSQEFTEAGLTPAFVFDPTSGSIELTSIEKLSHNFH